MSYVKQFKEKHGEEFLEETIKVLLGDFKNSDCDDIQCDDEGCNLHKSFLKYKKEYL